MGFVMNWIIFIFIVVIASMLKECQPCFSGNGTKEIISQKSGSDFYKECSCETKTRNVNLTWLGPDGEPIRSGSGSESRVYIVQQSVNDGEVIYELNIPRLNKDLNGVYQCVATESNGRKNIRNYEIEVYDPMYFEDEVITPQYLIEGRDSFIRCVVRASGEPMITWYKGNEGLTDASKYVILENGLLVKNVTKEDAGEYCCSATILTTAELGETYIHVEVWIPPKVTDIKSTEGTVIMEGDSLELTCEASGMPQPMYYWRKVQDLPQANLTDKAIPWKQESILDNKIKIESVTIDDHGLYVCIAKSDVGESSMDIFIEVLASPVITHFENVTVTEGSDETIICEAIGRPPPQILIECDNKANHHLFNESTDNNTRTSLQVNIYKVERIIEGACHCIANNTADNPYGDYNIFLNPQVGSSEESMFLEILHAPIFEKTHEDEWAYGDTPVNLNCESEARPPATVTWSYIGEEINTVILPQWAMKVFSNNDTYLIVNEPNIKFGYGHYECTAKNTIGEAKKHFRLRKGFRPAKLERNQVEVNVLTASSAIINIINTQSNDNPPLVGYTAEYDKKVNFNITNIHPNRSWALNVPYKLDNLKPATVYMVRIAALNLAGEGPYGDYHEFTTPEKSVPEPPLSENIQEPIQISANNKILKLKYPEDNGAPIDYYHIKYCPENGECLVQTISPITELDLNNLIPNTTYAVEIIAHNSVGNSTPSILKIILEAESQQVWLSAETIIGIAAVVVILCILILDILLFLTVKKGMIANCVVKKSKKKSSENKQSKDKKGLLKEKVEPVETKRPDNGHKEFEYNKTTGVITGKHSAV